MAKSEHLVKQWVKSLFDELTRFHFTVNTGGLGSSGYPDRMATLRGLSIGVECKATPGDAPTRLQALRLCELHAAGGFGFVVDRANFNAFATVLRQVAVAENPRVAIAAAWSGLPADRPWWR